MANWHTYIWIPTLSICIVIYALSMAICSNRLYQHHTHHSDLQVPLHEAAILCVALASQGVNFRLNQDPWAKHPHIEVAQRSHKLENENTFHWVNLGERVIMNSRMIILDDQARQQMTLHFQLSLQCNVSPIMGFVRHTAVTYLFGIIYKYHGIIRNTKSTVDNTEGGMVC